MAAVYRQIDASPEAVFDVLADGWLFPSWVVGASRIRGVDDAWPAVGSQIHHSFGVWPAVVDDVTTVLEWEHGRHALFQPKGWPLGEARVGIDIQARSGGSYVRMTEKAVKGPGALVPGLLIDPAIRLRNVEALRRLAWLTEGGAAA